MIGFLKRNSYAIGFVWNLPNTLLGCSVLMFLWMTRNGLEIKGNAVVVHGWISKLAKRAWRNKNATTTGTTFGEIIIVWIPSTPDAYVRLLKHENEHVRQGRVLGLLFFPVYFVQLAFYGYGKMPLENAARKAALDDAVVLSENERQDLT